MYGHLHSGRVGERSYSRLGQEIRVIVENGETDWLRIVDERPGGVVIGVSGLRPGGVLATTGHGPRTMADGEPSEYAVWLYRPSDEFGIAIRHPALLGTAHRDRVRANLRFPSAGEGRGDFLAAIVYCDREVADTLTIDRATRDGCWLIASKTDPEPIEVFGFDQALTVAHARARRQMRVLAQRLDLVSPEPGEGSCC